MKTKKNPFIKRTDSLIEWGNYLLSKIPPRFLYEVYSLINTFFASAIAEMAIEWGRAGYAVPDGKTALFALASVGTRAGIKALVELFLAWRGKRSPMVMALDSHE